MINNPTIDRVPRELIEQSEAAFKSLIKQITEEDEDGDYWRVRFESRRDQLRALLDAPAVERQEPVKWWNGCNETVPKALRYLANYERPSGGEQRFNALHLLQLSEEIEDMAAKKLYEVAPEVAALQSTIAQLQARVQELESGRGEAIGEVDFISCGEANVRLYGPSLVEGAKLYAAPPAPVVVVLPERKLESPLENRRGLFAWGWNSCLDATAALNTVHVGELDPAERLALARGEPK